MAVQREAAPLISGSRYRVSSAAASQGSATGSRTNGCHSNARMISGIATKRAASHREISRMIMSSFDVCWNRTWLTWYRRSESAPLRLEAILCERTLIEGKPALRIVGRLAGILEDELDNPASRDQFWRDASRKLGKLRRLNQRDIGQIETMLAKRIPKAK
jgi:hypothetical protein